MPYYIVLYGQVAGWTVVKYQGGLWSSSKVDSGQVARGTVSKLEGG